MEYQVKLPTMHQHNSGSRDEVPACINLDHKILAYSFKVESEEMLEGAQFNIQNPLFKILDPHLQQYHDRLLLVLHINR